MGTISCAICKTIVDIDQFDYHNNTDHLEFLPIRCLQCPLRFATFKLLKNHQIDKDHSNESNEAPKDRFKLSLAVLTAKAINFCAATEELVKKLQSQKGHSGDVIKVPYVLTLANLTKFYCETVEVVGMGDILISMEENFNLIGYNRKRKKETVANPTAKKSVGKRLASTSGLIGLTTESFEGNRRRDNLSPIRTAHDAIVVAQQVNLPSSTTSLQDNSAERHLESSLIVSETEKLDSVAISNDHTDADKTHKFAQLEPSTSDVVVLIG